MFLSPSFPPHAIILTWDGSNFFSFFSPTEYLNHAPCYRKLADDYKFCAEKYYAIYDKIRREAENQPPDVQLRNWCW